MKRILLPAAAALCLSVSAPAVAADHGWRVAEGGEHHGHSDDHPQGDRGPASAPRPAPHPAPQVQSRPDLHNDLARPPGGFRSGFDGSAPRFQPAPHNDLAGPHGGDRGGDRGNYQGGPSHYQGPQHFDAHPGGHNGFVAPYGGSTADHGGDHGYRPPQDHGGQHFDDHHDNGDHRDNGDRHGFDGNRDHGDHHGYDDHRDYGDHGGYGYDRDRRNFDRGFDHGRWQRNYHSERRYHWRPYVRPYGWYEFRWTYGMYLPGLFWQDREDWISDYWDFGLPDPPYGYVWVRDGDDALLIDEDSGYILQVVYGVFY